MEILYNQPIQMESDPNKSRRLKVTHIIAHTIQFSKDTPVYVIKRNLTSKKLRPLVKKLYIKHLLEKRLNKIMETERKKYSNHACNYCDHCTFNVNYINYIKKKFYEFH